MTNSLKRKKVLETLGCDTARLYGDLLEAAYYLIEVHAKHPNATLEEHWTGYEDMEMRFSWSRPETDEEMRERAEHEAATARFEAAQREKAKAREERRKIYLALKREFG